MQDFNGMTSRLCWTLPARQALSWAWYEAMTLGNFVVTPAHVLLGLEHHEGNASRLISERAPRLAERLGTALKRPFPARPVWRIDSRFQRILRSAKRLAKKRGDPAAGSGHLLAATLRVSPNLAPELIDAVSARTLSDIDDELARGKIVRDDRWSVDYETAPRAIYSCSKFGIGEAAMTYAALVRSWPRWSQTTRSHFASAFNAQCNWFFGPNERKIARFIARHAQGSVRVAGSSYLARLPSREAYPIIVRWLESADRKANLYLLLQNKAFLAYGSRSLLKAELRRHLKRRAAWDSVRSGDHDADLLDAVGCIEALWKLSPAPRYRRLLKKLSEHENELAAGWAKAALSRARALAGSTP